MTDAAEVQAKQAEYWNGDGAARWLANNQRGVDRTRASFAERALDVAAVKPGETVIEIGCGGGDTAVELAQLVGPTGKVLAVDVSQMLADETQKKIAPYPQASVIVGDASSYPFEEGSADLLFSRFGVMFFGDPTAAFAHMRQALKPAGRMAFVCWRSPEPNDVMEIVFRHFPRPAPGYVPGPQSLSDGQFLTRVLTDAGFSNIALEGMEGMRDIARGGGADAAVASAMETGPVHRMIGKASDAVKAAIAADLKVFFQSIQVDGAVMQPALVWVVTAANGLAPSA